MTFRTQFIPLDDGRILLCREARRAASSENGVEVEIVLLDGLRSTVRELVLGVIQSAGLVALRLLPGPMAGPVKGSGGDTPPAHLAVAIGLDTRWRSTIWRLAASPPYLERLAEIAGGLLGGVWLDSSGTFLGVERAAGGDGPAKAVAVDLRDGSCTPLLSVSKTSNDRLLGCNLHSRLLMVSTDAAGQERLGWAKLGADQPVCFPETLHRPGHTAPLPLTFDPDGQRVLLHVDDGVRSSLAVYTPAKDQLAPVRLPLGVVHGVAYWADGVLRFPFSTPSQPPGVATLCMGDTPGWSVAGSALVAETPWTDAHIERLDGAAGPIEAIVYGGEDWRATWHLLLALHGGPNSAWRFEFDPLFQRLAAAGIAVVAPNQRGSTGYGAAHTWAIHDAWGGPDLDDVRCIARVLDAERRRLGVPRLMLLGVSYGAFLALLAASCEPDLWSRCVALAPFLSGSRLYREAAPTIQALIRELGGLQELRDEVGPRDVLQLCDAIQAKLLIVHGGRDEMIPASQPRALRQRLLMLGKREGMDFEYLEIPDSRHNLNLGARTQAFHERLVRFLTIGTLNHVSTATA